MKITKIEKKKRLYLLEIDGKDTFYVTEDTIVHFMLSKEKVIDEAELQEIQAFANFSYGKNLALYYLSFKSRSAKEVRDYLIKHEITDDRIKEIIQQLTDEKWIDDRQYTQRFLQSNLLNGDKGAFVLSQKLQAKGISKQIIQEELQEIDLTAVSYKVAEKLARKYQEKLPPKALKEKIIQQLSQRGFSYNQAKIAYEELEVEEDQNRTQELLYHELEKQHRKYARKYDGYELKQRLTHALARKGYDFSDIASALRDYL